ncbi:MAG: N-acetylmannosamine kinase [Candidatus Celerinatantimonas neptuna]|nr:MAG: N-acetylmannosamine kinase [Candidatus Celerinatantimonas neptuna]
MSDINKLEIPQASQNERMIIDVIRRSPGILRSEVTRQTNLTQQSVHRILKGLLKKDVILLGTPMTSGRGQPSPTVTLNPKAWYSIGVSINTDTAAVILVDFCGNELATIQNSKSPTGPEKTLQWVKHIISLWLSKFKIPRAQIVGVGFAIMGYFIEGRRILRAPVPMNQWSHINLQSKLQQELNFNVWIANNATAAAIGEALSGAGLHYSDFAYLSFNYGFGAGIVIDGHPLFGAFGNAGEIGRIYQKEEMVKRPALENLLIKLASHDIHLSSISALHENFNPSWPGITQWVEETTPYLVRAINAFRATIDPQAIVIGGRIPHSLARLLLKSILQQGIFQEGDKSPKPDIFISEIEGEPILSGAALLPLRACFFHIENEYHATIK